MPTIGHNSGAASPFTEAERAVDLVWTEAKHWLDGALAETQTEADAIASLLNMARKAKAQADAARKSDAKPFDDGKAEVQARYKPILARCDTVAEAAKEALAPFLAAQEAAKRHAEEKARKAADEARQAAQAAFLSASGIDGRARAEVLADEAKQADIAARVAEKARGRAETGERAVSLRTLIKPEVFDLTALLRWVWENDRSALVGFANTYAAGAYRAGQRHMDGVRPVEIQSVA